MKVLLIALLVLTSCSQKNKQEYRFVMTYMKTNGLASSPQEAKPLIIRAISDSDAYIQSYMNFCFAKRSYKEEFDISGTIAGKPLSFRILNDSSTDITHRISFMNKDSLENRIAKRVAEYIPKKTSH